MNTSMLEYSDLLIILDEFGSESGKLEEIEGVIVPKNLQLIDTHLFSYLKFLKNIYYDGTFEDWCLVDKPYNYLESYNGSLLKYARHIYFKDESGEFYMLSGDILIPDSIKVINHNTFSNMKDIRSLDTNNVTEITAGAFSYCSGLRYVILNRHIKSTSNNIFGFCYGILRVEIRCDIDSIGGLGSCPRLVEIAYGSKTMNHFANSDINDSEYIGEIKLSEKSHINTDSDGFVTYAYGDEIALIDYVGCNQHVVIPDNITILNYAAFFHNDTICSVATGKNLRTISTEIFWWCKSLSTIILSNNISHIGNYIFDGIESNIKEVFVPKLFKVNMNFLTECENATVFYEGSEDDWCKKHRPYPRIVYNCTLETFYVYTRR